MMLPIFICEQVLEVVKGNYDTLTLKLQDNLDQYERYSEKPRETAFFTQMVRLIDRYFVRAFIDKNSDIMAIELIMSAFS